MKKSVGEFEELTLLTVGLLFPEAYGLAIADELEKQTGRKVLMSAVHKTLVRLEDKGFLKSHMGGATALRGGREKRLYTMSASGRQILGDIRELRNSMFRQIPKVAWEGGGGE